MRLFTIENNYPSIIPEVLLIPEFANIWNRDKSKTKENAKTELAYLYFRCSFDSPYLSYGEDDMIDKIHEDLFKSKKYKPDKDLLIALKKYEELSENPATNLLKGVRSGMEKLKDFLLTVNLHEKTKAGNTVHKPSEITRALADVSKMFNSYNELFQRAQSEESNSDKLRGGTKGGLLEFED
jgi:hypothetical protein